MSSRPRVYLAGPITGLNYDGATDWRTGVAGALLPHILTRSPLRGHEHLAALPQIGGTSQEEYLRTEISSAQGMTVRDRNDIMTSDAVLLNLLGATRVSIGSMIEAGWADAFRKPLIVVREPIGFHSHVILDTIATYTVADLDEALHLTRMLLLPY